MLPCATGVAFCNPRKFHSVFGNHHGVGLHNTKGFGAGEFAISKTSAWGRARLKSPFVLTEVNERNRLFTEVISDLSFIRAACGNRTLNARKYASTLVPAV